MKLPVKEIPLEMQISYEVPPINANEGDGALRPALAERRALLVVCGSILLLSSVLRINAAGHVYLPPFSGGGMPTICATKLLFHVDCPGCGITRSLVSLGHGDWRASLAYHPAGIAFYFFLWATVLSQITSLRRLRAGLPAPQSRALSIAGYGMIALFVLTGIYRIWLLLQS